MSLAGLWRVFLRGFGWLGLGLGGFRVGLGLELFSVGSGCLLACLLAFRVAVWQKAPNQRKENMPKEHTSSSQTADTAFSAR